MLIRLIDRKSSHVIGYCPHKVVVDRVVSVQMLWHPALRLS